MSTMAAPRSRRSAVPSTTATCEALGRCRAPCRRGSTRSTSWFRWPGRSPSGTASAGSDGPRPTGSTGSAAQGVAAMMVRIKADLAALGVHHDVFTSERHLVEAGRIDEALAHLDSLGLLYTGTLPPPKGKPVEDWEPVPQLLFRATAYRRRQSIGRSSARPGPGPISRPISPIISTSSAWRRHDDRRLGCRSRRLRQAAGGGGQGLSEGEGELRCPALPARQPPRRRPAAEDVEAGRTHRLAPRRGGRGRQGRLPLHHADPAATTRRSTSTCQKVVEQSKDNPVFYVQYAHARICSVLPQCRGRRAGRLRRGGLQARRRWSGWSIPPSLPWCAASLPSRGCSRCRRAARATPGGILSPRPRQPLPCALDPRQGASGAALPRRRGAGADARPSRHARG